MAAEKSAIDYEIKNAESPSGSFSYGHFNTGVRGLLLPYRKKLGTLQVLLRREWIPGWDSHTDICGISVEADIDTVENSLIEAVKEEAGYTLALSDFKSLGVCGCDRRTDTMCYLYAVDLSRRDSAEEKCEASDAIVFWGTEEDVLDSLDSQLIACLARLKYMVF